MEDKKRKTNWSKEEIEVLSEEASSRINVIQGKFSNFLTHSDKKLCWQEITSKVNSVSVAPRTQKEVYKKWADLKNRVKRKAVEEGREAKKTGGGPAHIATFEAHEQQVLGTIAKSSIHGIEGGFDTADEVSSKECAEVIKKSQIDARCTESDKVDPFVEGKCSTSTDSSCTSGKKTCPKSMKRSSEDFNRELLDIEREKGEYRVKKLRLLQDLVCETKKTREVMETIVSVLKLSKEPEDNLLLSVSPIIKIPEF